MKKNFWKNILIVLFCSLFMSIAAQAATFKMTVELLEPFDINKPPKTLTTRVVEDYVFNNKEKIAKDSVFTGEVVQIVEPKIGKRDSYFYYKLTSYTKPSSYEAPIEINNEKAVVKATFYKSLDKKDMTLSAGTTIAGLFVDNIAYPINFVRGVVEPYDGKGRMQSGAQKMYEKSMFSYASEGRAMVLNKGDKINLTLYYEKEQ